MSETISSTMDNLSVQEISTDPDNLPTPEISTSDEKQKTTADPDSLTADLIELIATKATSIEDFVRFGAVRRSWRLATLTVKSRLNYLSLCPLLLVGKKNPDEYFCHLHSVATGERFQIESPWIGGPCWGSPFGWVCVEFRLVNPLTGASLDLPIGRRRNSSQVFVRTVLIASLDDPDCVFFSIKFMGQRVLSYLRPGDPHFSHVNTRGWSDIIRFKGNFYGCLCDGKVLLLSSASSDKSLELTAAEFAAAPPELCISSPAAEEVPAVLNVKYLVDLGGELCMVIRYAKETDTDPANSEVTAISTFGFEIYKLDVCTKNWERLLSLDDKCIFVGASYSYSIRASSSSSLKPNCIYFTDDFSSFKYTINTFAFENPYRYSKSRIKDMGIYNIENGQVTAFTTMLSVSDEELQCPYFSPIWFTPALQ